MLILALNCYSQKINSDPVIKDIRLKYKAISESVLQSQKDSFEFNYGDAYINEQGDTVYEGEGELRDFIIFIKENHIIRIIDSYTTTEGESRTRSTEYNLYNDTLLFVFVSEEGHSYNEMDDDGYRISRLEERIYFKNLKPYYHLRKDYSGYTNDSIDFKKDVSNRETDTNSDFIYTDELKEIVNNYLNNHMDAYRRVIERKE